MKKVYITGANGFIGKNLSEYLKIMNYSVIEVLRHSKTEVVSINYQEYFNRLPDNDSAVIHLAGKAHDLKKSSDERLYFEVNYELTKQVYDAFLKSEASIFVFMSSVKAVKDRVCGVLSEDECPTPITPYGKSKLKAEEYILANMPIGKRVYIVRPSMVHGPGNKGNLNLLYHFVAKGIPYPLAGFDNERSFLSVDNLNFLLERMLKEDSLLSGVYQFSDDEYISTNSLIRIISKVIEKKARLVNIPKKLLFGLAKIGDFLKLPIDTDRLTKLTENFRVSNQKIKNALGIDKLPISAEKGLEKTIQSFLNKK